MNGGWLSTATMRAGELCASTTVWAPVPQPMRARGSTGLPERLSRTDRGATTAEPPQRYVAGEGFLSASAENVSRQTGRVAVLTVDGEVRFRVFHRKTRRLVELATLDSDGKVAGNERVDRDRRDVRIDGTVAHTFVALDLAELNYLEDPPPE